MRNWQPYFAVGWRLAIAAVVTLTLAACSGVNGIGPTSAKLGGRLTVPQVDAVTLAAREMSDDPTAQVYGLVSKPSLTGTGSLDVCGYVRRAGHADDPLYVEVDPKAAQDAQGAQGAQGAQAAVMRGQIGNDDAKLAKVRFMCRAHEGW